jgi:predicted RNase H-like HicB family nuclease
VSKNVEHGYTYKVEWSEEDGEYVGTVEEFPGLSWVDDSPTKTLAGIRRITEECVGCQPTKESNHSSDCVASIHDHADRCDSSALAWTHGVHDHAVANVDGGVRTVGENITRLGFRQ